MNPGTDWDGDSNMTGRRAGKRPLLAGVEVREEDLEPQKGLDVASTVVHVSSGVILLLALAQFGVWWLDRPPGGAGMGLLVGDTIRLIVLSALLWAAGDVIKLMIKTHYDVRAARILLTRQTYMMRHMGVSSGELPVADEPVGARRAQDAQDGS